MPKLIFPPSIFRELQDIVGKTDMETGVRLIGIVAGGNYTVLHLIGPGENARRERYAYECDNDYAERRFAELLEADPALIFLGELHAHPDLFCRLSATDLETVEEVLKQIPEFIAGVILRSPLTLHPIHFPSGESLYFVF